MATENSESTEELSNSSVLSVISVAAAFSYFIPRLFTRNA
jgi:hypothetical protein